MKGSIFGDASASQSISEGQNMSNTAQVSRTVVSGNSASGESIFGSNTTTGGIFGGQTFGAGDTGNTQIKPGLFGNAPAPGSGPQMMNTNAPTFVSFFQG